MDFKMQLSGLNDFLGSAYGQETQLNSLLTDLGFERTQIDLLNNKSLECLVSGFVTVIKDKLSSGNGKGDHVFQVACRRYGLDGETPETPNSIAKKHSISAQYVQQLEEEALQKCRLKTTLNDLSKSLQYLAVAELSKIAPAPTRGYVSEKLFRLTNLQADTDLTRMDYNEKRAGLFERIQAELDALEAEYQPVFETAGQEIAALTAEIKNDVLLRGESVQGGAYCAVYTQGRGAWDNDGMTKYAAAHPDVLKFRKPGQASVTLRTVQEK
jgi:hypothetical protein